MLHSITNTQMLTQTDFTEDGGLDGTVESPTGWLFRCRRKENEAVKCKTCEVMKRIEDSNEPACCIWYMKNVVCGDKSVEDCTAYEPPKGE